MKQFIAALLLVTTLQGVSAQTERGSSGTQTSVTTIDIEPEQCVTRCFFIRGVPVYCYTLCY